MLYFFLYVKHWNVERERERESTGSTTQLKNIGATHAERERNTEKERKKEKIQRETER